MEILASTNKIINIGYVGEHLATKVVFNISKWIEKYGVGAVNLVIEQNGQTYPQLTTFSDEKVTWLVTNSNTAMAGAGRCELTYSVGDIVVKSAIYNINVFNSISGNEEEAPPSYQSWVDEIMGGAVIIQEALPTINQALSNIEGIEISVTNIKEEAVEAQGLSEEARDASISAKEDSEAWAIGEKNNIPVEITHETYENNSKYYSTIAMSSAEGVNELKEESEAWAVGKKSGVDVESGDITYHNNAKFYAGSAEGSASIAQNSLSGMEDIKTDSLAFKEDSEAWATGQRNGINVLDSDTTYQNNAKFYSNSADIAKSDAETAKDLSETAQGLSETAQGLSEGFSEDAKAWAIGTLNTSHEAYERDSKRFAENSEGSANLAEGFKNDSMAWAIGVDDIEHPAYENSAQYWADRAQAVSQAYVHPETHPASMIIQNSSYRFVTDLEKDSWDKQKITIGLTQPTSGWWYKEII